jgi:hypothetical protein
LKRKLRRSVAQILDNEAMKFIIAEL